MHSKRPQIQTLYTYYHQEMQEPDSEKFRQAIINEVNAYIEGDHWRKIPFDKVPKGKNILDSVWEMRQKKEIKTC